MTHKIYRGGDAQYGSAATTLLEKLASTSAGLGASLIGVEDADSKYAASTVEGVLAELGDVALQQSTALSITGGSIDGVTMGATTPIPSLVVTDITMSEGYLAAVNQAVTSTSVVDMCIIDTTRDTNSEWIKKTAYLSYGLESVPSGSYLGRYASESAARTAGGTTNDWYQRTTTSDFYSLDSGSGETQIYRAGRSEFPKFALAVAETDRVVIYDLVGATGVEMWMVFSRAGGNILNGTSNVTSITYKESILVVGLASDGVDIINFSNEKSEVIGSATHYLYSGNISNRNSTSGFFIIEGNVIVNAAVNDVAITVLDTAPLNAFGLKEPTIAVATDSGTSVITQDGDIWDSNVSTAVNSCTFIDNFLWFGNDTTADITYIAVSSITADAFTGTLLDETTSPPISISSTDYTDALTLNARGTPNSLVLFHDYELISRITTTYNTGWMLGDVRRALLANSKTADRSVKASTLTENGTVTESTISGSELKAYSGFSAANYFSQAYSADLDFGTADFNVSWWFKQDANTAIESHWCRGYYTGAAWSGASIEAYTAVSGAITILVTDDGYATYDSITTSGLYDDGEYHLAELYRESTTLYLVIDGIAVGSTTLTNAAGSLSNASASLQVGYRQDSVYPATNLSLTLLRFSATAPTTEQIKFAYETEKQMFNNNCLLAGSSDAVTALDYDEVTDLLHVGTSSGRTAMNGLTRVDYEATPVGAIQALEAHGKMISNGGASGSDIYIPQLNLREQAIERLVSDEDADDGEWKDLELLNSWVPYTTFGTQNLPQYRKDKNNRIHLRGLIKSGTITDGTSISTLPTGFRPNLPERFPSYHDNAGTYTPHLTIIGGNGEILIYSVTGNTWLALDGISFLAEQ